MAKQDGNLQVIANAMSEIEKTYGKGSIMNMANTEVKSIPVISTGNIKINKALGVGGLPRGRIIEVYGPESCLAEESTVRCNTTDSEGKISTTRKWKIKRLYERFHNIEVREKTKEYEFYTTAVDKDNRVFMNKIYDVVKTGLQECFVMTTSNGFKSPHATLKHKFMSNDGIYVKLGSLVVGDAVYIYHNTVKPDTITSIASVGLKETYDIKCYVPHNNYIADKFVVHNSGKTTLCLHAMAEAIADGGKVAFIDAEHALDMKYAEALGVKKESLYLSQPDYGEQALEITETLVRTNAFDVIVVDSVAALVPRSEVEGDMGDAQMGLQARLMSQAMRKLTGYVSNSNTVLIFVNQLRSKIGVTWGSSETTTGGNALKFYATIRIDIRRIGAVKQGENIIGNVTKVKIIKNKVAPPFKVVEVKIMYGMGISKLHDVFDHAVEYGIFQKGGAWVTYGELRWNGMNKAIEALAADNLLYNEVLNKVLTIIKQNDDN